MFLYRLKSISLYPMSWDSQTSAIFAKSQILQGSRMPKSQCCKSTEFSMIKNAQITKLSNMQTVTFKMLVTSHYTKAILRNVLKKRKKRLIGHGLYRLQSSSLYPMPWRSQTSAIFAKAQNLTRAKNAQITMLQKHRIFNDQGCQNHSQSCQIYRL